MVGILDTTSGTIPSQFVLLAFLTFDNVKHLKDSLKKLGKWHNIFMGGFTYVQEAPCIGGIDLLSVLVFVSQDDFFTGYFDLVNEGSTRLVLDGGSFTTPNASRKYSQAIDSLRKRKSCLINNCVIKY